MILTPILTLAAFVAAPSGAAALERDVSQAALELCFRAESGDLNLAGGSALGATGFARAPAAVEDSAAAATPGRGRPIVVRKGMGDDLVVLLFWPQAHVCNVTFGGSQSDKAMDALRTQVENSDSSFQRDSARTKDNASVKIETFTSKQEGSPLTMMLVTPKIAQPSIRHSVLVLFQGK